MKIDEKTHAREKLEITSTDIGSVETVLGTKKIRAAIVCKACGRVLTDRDGSGMECDGAGPHAPVAVDLSTARVDGTTGRVIAAVHLE